MMRKLCVGILLSLMLTSSIVPAQASSKVGSKCKKIGLISQTLSKKTVICQIKGKVLRWTLKTDQKSTSNDLNISEDPWISIAKKYQKSILEQKSWDGTLREYISPNISDNLKLHYIPQQIESLRDGLKFLNSLGVNFAPTYGVAFFTEKDSQWVEEVLRLQCTNPAEWFLSSANHISGDGGQCLSNLGYFIDFQILGSEVSLKEIDQFDSILIHEMMHSVQLQEMKIDFQTLQTRRPCWFVEGMPNLIKTYERYILSSGNVMSVDSFRNRFLRQFASSDEVLMSIYNKKLETSFLLDDWLDLSLTEPAFGSKCRTQADGRNVPAFGYTIGQFITEKFLIDFGWHSYISLLRLNGSGFSFEESFEKIAGKSQRLWLTDSGLPYVVRLGNNLGYSWKLS